MNQIETVRLGSLMASKNGSVDPSKFPDEMFDLFSIPAFDRGSSELTVGSSIGSPKQLVQEGDVLLAKIVPHIRRSWIVRAAGNERTIASGEWIVFRAPSVHAPYLRHALLSDTFHAQFMNTVAGVGGSLLRARPAFVADLRIPLPKPAEQRRIAEVLDRVQALHAKRRRAIALLDDLAKSVFLDMFGDPSTNPMSWPIRRIGDLIDSASYGTSEKASLEGDIPVLRMGNITLNGEIDQRDLKYMSRASIADRHIARSGDVLFNRTNSPDLVGKTAIYTGIDPLAFAGYLIRVRTNHKNHPEYLAAFLNTSYSKMVLRNMCKSIVGMANINAQELQGIHIGEPPLDLQREFARRIAAVRSLKATHLAYLAELDALFASLQYRAFRGEL